MRRANNLNTNLDGIGCMASTTKQIQLEVTNVGIFCGIYIIKEISPAFAQTQRALLESGLESMEPNWNDPINT